MRRAVLFSLEGDWRPGGKAQDHRQAVRGRLPGAGKENQARALARPGHDLPGRDRVGRREDQEAATIKSHHNVGGLPETLHLKLLEPLRELFKDEVRELGLALGLPREIVFRHPFPGPGLGVRILGEVNREYADLLRQADAIFTEELRSSDWYEQTAQAFAVFLPVKSVGVMGDGAPTSTSSPCAPCKPPTS